MNAVKIVLCLVMLSVAGASFFLSGVLMASSQLNRSFEYICSQSSLGSGEAVIKKAASLETRLPDYQLSP